MHIHSRARNFALAALLIATAVTGPARAQDEDLIVSHCNSTIGALKYPEGYANFYYVNPDAPKGGIYHTWDL
jgi:microcin C transport system substrate-binding protein